MKKNLHLSIANRTFTNPANSSRCESCEFITQVESVLYKSFIRWGALFSKVEGGKWNT